MNTHSFSFSFSLFLSFLPPLHPICNIYSSYSLIGNTETKTKKVFQRPDILVTPSVLKNYYQVPLCKYLLNSNLPALPLLPLLISSIDSFYRFYRIFVYTALVGTNPGNVQGIAAFNDYFSFGALTVSISPFLLFHFVCILIYIYNYYSCCRASKTINTSKQPMLPVLDLIVLHHA